MSNVKTVKADAVLIAKAAKKDGPSHSEELEDFQRKLAVLKKKFAAEPAAPDGPKAVLARMEQKLSKLESKISAAPANIAQPNADDGAGSDDKQRRREIEKVKARVAALMKRIEALGTKTVTA